jgi:hypothetical protein
MEDSKQQQSQIFDSDESISPPPSQPQPRLMEENVIGETKRTACQRKSKINPERGHERTSSKRFRRGMNMMLKRKTCYSTMREKEQEYKYL